jgi:uncharacterized membrane protein YedE/YeeE
MSPLLSAISSLFIGLLFGAGLIVAGMVDPLNVQGFLDVTGNWRPQLIAVLGVGMLVTTVMYAIAKRRSHPMVEPGFHWPHATAIDRKLIVGSVLFGAGWALAGYCPGPALVAVGAISGNAVVFVIAMAVGGYLHHKFGSK